MPDLNMRRDEAIDLFVEAMSEFSSVGCWFFPDDTDQFVAEVKRLMRQRSEDDALPIMACYRCGYTNACAICEDGRREAYLDAKAKARPKDDDWEAVRRVDADMLYGDGTA